MVGGGVVDGFTWSQTLDHKCSHSRMIPPSFICLIQTGALDGRAHFLAVRALHASGLHPNKEGSLTTILRMWVGMLTKSPATFCVTGLPKPSWTRCRQRRCFFRFHHLLSLERCMSAPAQDSHVVPILAGAACTTWQSELGCTQFAEANQECIVLVHCKFLPHWSFQNDATQATSTLQGLPVAPVCALLLLA